MARSAWPATRRRKMATSGSVVGSIIAEVISTQPPTYSTAGTTSAPPATAEQIEAPAPSAVQSWFR